jgi:hypothetical protein
MNSTDTGHKILAWAAVFALTTTIISIAGLIGLALGLAAMWVFEQLSELMQMVLCGALLVVGASAAIATIIVKDQFR